MRIKMSLFWILLIVAPLISLTTTIAYSQAARIYVDPVTSFGELGESFTVDINVADIPAPPISYGVHTWQVNMSFDPLVLEFINVTEGDYLKDQPEGSWTVPPAVNDTAGWALFTWFTQGEYPGVPGSGWLATVEFLILSEGETFLNITHPETYLVQMEPVGGGYIPSKIPCTQENGFFSSLISPPVADFTYSPQNPRKNETVTFNASASYDPDGNITSYEWDFGDGTTKKYIGANLTANTTHDYATSGTKGVTLNVTDDSGLWSLKTVNVFVRFTHDIAVTDVSASAEEVTAGQSVSIEVKITNQGAETESFSVDVYYDGTAVATTQNVTDLEPDSSRTLTFTWDTTEVAPDDYTIKGEAVVVDDEQLEDNSANDFVTVRAPAAPFPMELVIAAVVIIVIVVAIVVFLYMRRK